MAQKEYFWILNFIYKHKRRYICLRLLPFKASIESSWSLQFIIFNHFLKIKALNWKMIRFQEAYFIQIWVQNTGKNKKNCLREKQGEIFLACVEYGEGSETGENQGLEYLRTGGRGVDQAHTGMLQGNLQ